MPLRLTQIPLRAKAISFHTYNKCKTTFQIDISDTLGEPMVFKEVLQVSSSRIIWDTTNEDFVP